MSEFAESYVNITTLDNHEIQVKAKVLDHVESLKEVDRDQNVNVLLPEKTVRQVVDWISIYDDNCTEADNMLLSSTDEILVQLANAADFLIIIPLLNGAVDCLVKRMDGLLHPNEVLLRLPSTAKILEERESEKRKWYYLDDSDDDGCVEWSDDEAIWWNDDDEVIYVI